MEASELLLGRRGKVRRVFIEIPGGYTMRHLVEYCHLTMTDVNLIFNSKGIGFCKPDATGHITNELRIFADRLPYFLFHTDEEEIVFGLTFTNLRLITQNINRRHGIRFIMYNNSKNLYVPITGTEAGTINEGSGIKPQHIEEARITMDHLNMDEYELVCVIPTARIHSTLQSFCKIKAPSDGLYANIKVFERGIRFMMTDPARITEKIEYFGIIPEAAEAELEEEDFDNPTENMFFIRKPALKAMIKLGSVNSSGATVSVRYSPRKPLILTWSIENIGELRIFINPGLPSA